MELIERKKLAVFILGYVGLPQAVAFAECHQILGYDNDPQRITELKSGVGLKLNKKFFCGYSPDRVNPRGIKKGALTL